MVEKSKLCISRQRNLQSPAATVNKHNAHTTVYQQCPAPIIIAIITNRSVLLCQKDTWHLYNAYGRANIFQDKLNMKYLQILNICVSLESYKTGNDSYLRHFDQKRQWPIVKPIDHNSVSATAQTKYRWTTISWQHRETECIPFFILIVAKYHLLSVQHAVPHSHLLRLCK